MTSGSVVRSLSRAGPAWRVDRHQGVPLSSHASSRHMPLTACTAFRGSVDDDVIAIHHCRPQMACYRSILGIYRRYIRRNDQVRKCRTTAAVRTLADPRCRIFEFFAASKTASTCGRSLQTPRRYMYVLLTVTTWCEMSLHTRAVLSSSLCRFIVRKVRL